MTARARTEGAAPLTRRQAARREAILAAGTALAADGGYEAVQMREVAERSGVALGTLYRYFPSKVHLLVAIMVARLDTLRETVRHRPPAGETAGERVTETLMRTFRALRREPRLADAMLRALHFADRSVSTEVEQVLRLTTAIVLAPAGITRPTPAQRSAVRVIEHTWYSTLIAWASGRATIEQVRTDLETACRLLEPGGPGPGGDRPVE
ncbi:TetR family transcriptional regulator [Streptomyces sp. NPDC058045]|uniref:TetR family transcriptional regulator n=1 Tax=Streptomyces sp. NPDC058045 TaxID=3346311 RepID=UPI0036E38C2A